MQDFLSDHHMVPLFVPVADAFAAGLTSEVISLQNYRRASCFVMTGAIEDANISNILTVLAADDTTPSNTTAMAFKHRAMQYSTTVDTWGALTAAAATGYNFASNNAVANAVWFFEIVAADVEAAQAGYEFFQVAIAETANKTVTAAGFALLSEPRFPGAVPVSAIA